MTWCTTKEDDIEDQIEADMAYTAALDAISEADLEDCLAELEFQTWVFQTFPCRKP